MDRTPPLQHRAETARYAAELQLLAEPAINAVSPWLLPLERTIGNLSTLRDETSGEPDGYGGVEVRGDYQRLLVSEWLMAVEEPDEFIRRAAMHEHLFLARQYVDPAGTKESLLLFDVGPEQLGSPRLAQLALMLVFARRAENAAALMQIGLLQQPEQPLHPLSRAAVRRWLTARTMRPPRADLEAWQAALEHRSVDDLWVIGSVDSASVAKSLGADLITISETIHGGELFLEVVARRKRVADARVMLAVPAEGGLILRSPLARDTRREARSSGVQLSSLGRLTVDGVRFILPGKDSWRAYHVPSSQSVRAGNAKKVPNERSDVIAIDVFGGRPIALYCRAGNVVIGASGLSWRKETKRHGPTDRSIGALYETQLDVPLDLEPQPSTPVAELHVYQSDGSSLRAWILDRRGQLWWLQIALNLKTRQPEICSLSLREPRCLGFASLGQGAFAWLSGTNMSVVQHTPDGQSEQELPAGTSTKASCVFARQATIGKIRHAVVDQRVAEVAGPDTNLRFECPGEIVGLTFRVFRGSYTATPHVLHLQPDRCGVVLRGPTDEHELLHTPKPIAECRYQDSCAGLIYSFGGNHRGIYSVEHGVVRWHGEVSDRGAL